MKSIQASIVIRQPRLCGMRFQSKCKEHTWEPESKSQIVLPAMKLSKDEKVSYWKARTIDTAIY